jgi:hypothetical protein
MIAAPPDATYKYGPSSSARTCRRTRSTTRQATLPKTTSRIAQRHWRLVFYTVTGRLIANDGAHNAN